MHAVNTPAQPELPDILITLICRQPSLPPRLARLGHAREVRVLRNHLVSAKPAHVVPMTRRDVPDFRWKDSSDQVPRALVVGTVERARSEELPDLLHLLLLKR